MVIRLGLVCILLRKLRFAAVKPSAATVHRTVAFDGSSPGMGVSI